MIDRSFVLRWANLGADRNPGWRQIIEEDRAALGAHMAEIQARP